MLKISSVSLSFVVMFIATSTTVNAKARTFNRPTLLGDRLSACYGSGSGCGKPVADAYCVSRGYNEALSYRLNRDPQSSDRARTLDNQIVSVSAKTPEFVYVKCYTPRTADRK